MYFPVSCMMSLFPGICKNSGISFCVLLLLVFRGGFDGFTAILSENQGVSNWIGLGSGRGILA